MSLSTKVLANIKRAHESDENEQAENALLEVLKSFPETTTAIDSIEEMVPKCEDLKEELEICVDPLFNNVETFPQNGFIATYQDKDIINNENSNDYEKNAKSLPRKKARFQGELKGRNGYTWSTIKPTAPDKDSLDSALHFLQPRGKGPAQTISNVLEMWSLLIDEQIVAQIVHHTNEEIKQRRGKLPYHRRTDPVELRSWIGLNYLCGIFRNATYNGPLDELWSLELGNAIFRATMSFKRFEFILECIRFGGNVKQTKKLELEPVLGIWKKFLINCRSYYAPSGNCAIDEVTMNYINIKKVPRMLMICDAKTLYMSNALLNSGRDHTERDITRLVTDIKGSRRNIVLSKKYTSIELINKLLEMNVSVLGALPNTAKEIPQEILSSNISRKLYSNTVTLLATQHPPNIFLSSGLPSNVNVERLYSLSCSTCESFQKSACKYSTCNATQLKNNCWSLNFFQNMLDYAITNAWVLFLLSSNGDGNMNQRDFQRHLGLYLTQQQLKRQLQANRLSLPQKVQISEVLGESTDQLLSAATVCATKAISTDFIPHEKLRLPDGVTLMAKKLDKRLCCRKCHGRNAPKTKTRCQQCLRPLCQKHYIVRCRDCMGLPETETSNNNDTEPVRSESDGDQEQDDLEFLGLK